MELSTATVMPTPHSFSNTYRISKAESSTAILTETICELLGELSTEKKIEERKKLPLDVVYEVLTWCDTNALASHRLVCKQWRHLLWKSHFIHHHLERTKTLRGFFLQKALAPHKYEISFLSPNSPPALQYMHFLPEAVKIEASTGGQTGHGLLCCVNEEWIFEPRYYVCKPTTEEWTRIPNPKMRFSTIKMGMGVMNIGYPPVFKIVRLSKFANFRTKSYFTEVFDSEKWKWELLQSQELLDFKNLGMITGTGLFLNTSLYWLSIPFGGCSSGMSLIVSFDIETNKWFKVRLPETLVVSNRINYGSLMKKVKTYKLKLVNMGGDLGLVCKSDTQIDVWVMVSKVNQIWEKKVSFQSNELGWNDIHAVLGLFADDVALVLDWNSGLQWYNYGANEYTETKKKLREFFVHSDDIHFFQSDYVPCNIGQKVCNFPTGLPGSTNSMKKGVLGHRVARHRRA